MVYWPGLTKPNKKQGAERKQGPNEGKGGRSRPVSDEAGVGPGDRPGTALLWSSD